MSIEQYRADVLAELSAMKDIGLRRRVIDYAIEQTAAGKHDHVFSNSSGSISTMADLVCDLAEVGKPRKLPKKFAAMRLAPELATAGYAVSIYKGTYQPVLTSFDARGKSTVEGLSAPFENWADAAAVCEHVFASRNG